MQIRINYETCLKVGKLLEKIKPMKIDMFDNEDFFPPMSSPKEDVFLYFLVMVSIDHRLSYHNKPFEGTIEGKFYHGSDALYKLGIIKYRDDPSFFYPENLVSLNENDMIKWLTIENKNKEIYPSDIKIRLELVKDIGNKIKKNFKDPYDIIIISKGYLRRGINDGFIDILKIFKAYQDPVEKKPFLLAKFLERRGVLNINDPYNKEVPVDNHLTRVALRLGLVETDEMTREKIAAQQEFSESEDVMLRFAIREAYRIVSQSSGMDPFIMDDILWSFGRNCCKIKEPVCIANCNNECKRITGCKDSCVLAKECKAYSEKIYMIPEHNFKKTWWY
ncbi:MAG: hypothetical protein RXN81_06335 [Caldisphaera sp.]